jgi:hypothetical protein
MLLIIACHQVSGSCSDQSGRGVESVKGVVALASTAPDPSMSRAFAPVVEMSIPSSKLMRQVKYHDNNHTSSSDQQSQRPID